ncbi:PDZ domain-containing protein [Melghirimyces profundicolus]|uniref:PDZ domain-containing protein n=1 Tax=Melghirimyces profundicolus TaxID=1242148 RepID=UPI000D3DBD73|nr:PDZ domain-containing protein [Melghirimyces profundicolus]
MEFSLMASEHPLTAVKSLLVHPFWLVALLLAAWQYAWKNIREQQTWGSRLSPPTPLFLRTLLVGCVAGGLISLSVSFFTLDLKPGDLIRVWIVTLVLGTFNLRLACTGIAVGILSLLSLTARGIGAKPGILPDLSVFSAGDWLFLAGLLHLAEWFMVRLDGGAGMMPITVKVAHGRWVGGHLMRKIWPVPLLAATPAGWLPVPLVSGFARVNLSISPEQQRRRSSSLVLVYGVGLTILTLSGVYGMPVLLWAAAVYAILGHEALYWVGRYREIRRPPLFTPAERGIKVLAVLSASPAEEMGIRPGDTLLRVNGEETDSMDEVKRALQKSPAFSKLELLDEHGDPKLAQRPVYEGDPSDLGLVKAPDPVAGKDAEGAPGPEPAVGRTV